MINDKSWSIPDKKHSAALPFACLVVMGFGLTHVTLPLSAAEEPVAANRECPAEVLNRMQGLLLQARLVDDPQAQLETLDQALQTCQRYDWLMESAALSLTRQQWVKSAQGYADAGLLARQTAAADWQRRQLLATSFEGLAWLRAGSLDLALAAVTEADDGYRQLNSNRPDFLGGLIRELDSKLADTGAQMLVTALQQQVTRGLSRGISVTPKVSLQVLFEFDSDQLTAEGHKTTQKIAEAIDLIINSRAFKNTEAEFAATSHILLIGHTDTQGSEVYNQQLSEKRAAAVAEQVAAKVENVSIGDSLMIVGRGESEPRYFDSTEADHQRNRRVEMVIVR